MEEPPFTRRVARIGEQLRLFTKRKCRTVLLDNCGSLEIYFNKLNYEIVFYSPEYQSSASGFLDCHAKCFLAHN